MYDWNDLRHFLAVARTGSTLAASRSLGVNQTTTARRVAILEKAMGMKLFDRKQAGYALTESGKDLLAAAERVENRGPCLRRAGQLHGAPDLRRHPGDHQ